MQPFIVARCQRVTLTDADVSDTDGTGGASLATSTVTLATRGDIARSAVAMRHATFSSKADGRAICVRTMSMTSA